MTHKILIMVAAMWLASCNGSAVERRTIEAPPSLPKALSSLPVEAYVECPQDPDMRHFGINLFEYPASLPEVGNSGTGAGGSGDVTGDLLACDKVKITKTSWSQYKKAYYVFVEAGSESGWISATYVQFDVPITATLTPS